MKGTKKGFRARSQAERDIAVFLDSEDKHLALDVKGENLPRNLDLIANKANMLVLSAPKVRDFTSLSCLSNLQFLLISAKRISDVSFLNKMPNIIGLRILGARELSSIDVSSMSDLLHLDLISCPRITSLDFLPPRNRLKSLDISGSGVVDLEPLTRCSDLQSLTAQDSKIKSIKPLSSLSGLLVLNLNTSLLESLDGIESSRGIEDVNAGNTPIRDITPLYGMEKLLELSISNTRVHDLMPIASMKSLKELFAAGINTVDISAVKYLENLRYLIIDRSTISDLSPAANLLSLADAAVESLETDSRDFSGFEYTDTLASDFNSVFQRTSNLSQPYRTVEAINVIRRQLGKLDYFPPRYKRPDDIDAILNGTIDLRESDETIAELRQRPATYSFNVAGGRVEAEATAGAAIDVELAAEIHHILLDKTRAAVRDFEETQFAKKIIKALNQLESCLGQSIEDVKPGILLMCFRSLESLRSSFETPAGREELSEAKFATLVDLCESNEDFMSCFPKIARIQSERLALAIQEADLPLVMQQMDLIRGEARHSAAVGRSAIAALDLGAAAIKSNNEIISSPSSPHHEVAAAIENQSRVVTQKLLDLFNFSSRVIRSTEQDSKLEGDNIGDEVSGLLKDSWREFRQHFPQGIGKGAEAVGEASVRAAFLALAVKMAGPLVGIAALTRLFRPLGNAAKRIRSEESKPTKRKKEEKPPKPKA